MDYSISNNNDKLFLVRELLYFYCLGMFILERCFVEVTLWGSEYPILWPITDFIIDQYANVISIILITCIIFTFFTTRPSVVRILAFVAIIAVGRIASEVQEDIYFYNAMLLLVGAYGVRARRLLIFVLSISGPLLILTVLASKLGIIHNEIAEGRHREYLGFSWTTTPVMIFCYVTFIYIILRRCKLTIIDFLILNAVNFYFFKMTNTKFSFLIIILITTLCFVYNNVIGSNEKPGLNASTTVLFPWMFAALIYIVSYLYDPSIGIMGRLNILLSKRLSQTRYSLSIYNILPFGQPISWVSTGDATVDNPATYVDTAYLQTLLKYGWIPLVMLLLISSWLILRAYLERRYYIAVVFVFILVFGLFEQQLFWYEYDIILLLSFADWRSLKAVEEREGVRWASRKFLRQIP